MRFWTCVHGMLDEIDDGLGNREERSYSLVMRLVWHLLAFEKHSLFHGCSILGVRCTKTLCHQIITLIPTD